MSNPTFQGEFIELAEAHVLENLSNEQFGVSELAELMNMSRSNLLRRIKKDTQLSASQFIRQIRLQKGMQLLKQTELSVSEVSFQVGFGNTSYFIKCFREQYGYPPGKVGKGETGAKESIAESAPKRKRWPIIIGISLVVVITFALIFSRSSVATDSKDAELSKSIAVLPFKNMSSDSTNLYFVSGLMESTLNNLQKIEDLRVVSRTSVDKYRNVQKTAPEIAEELDVSYLVEGSGQRVGDEVLLNIQLIDAANDRPVWVEQYNYEVVDVFTLQNEIARKIADAIEANVTPAELAQIDKQPTDDLEAYDFYLQALEPFNSQTTEGLRKAIPLFKKAIGLDPQFALAHSKLAIAYYFLDVYMAEKKYTDSINLYADRALLYDPKSDESLIAKALYYMHNEEFRLAVPHLEKALEYNPNSASVVQLLAILYSRSLPDTSKYLEYALKGVQLDIAANDSVGKSYIYLSLSNALIQSGFVDESLEYINRSLDYDPKNYYGPYLQLMISYAKEPDLKRTKDGLVALWKKDTTRMDILQEVGKFNFYLQDIDSAFYYYDKFSRVRKEQGLNIYPHENMKIGWVYEKMGLTEQAEELYRSYEAYCKRDVSIYQPASQAILYIHEGKYDEAIEQFDLFSQNNNFQYWMLIFLDIDPMISPLKSHPEYEATIQKIHDRFWKNQESLKEKLDRKGLLKT